MKMKDLRDWMFRSLMFEAKSDEFRKAGILIGHRSGEEETQLLLEGIDPFPIQLRNDALQMARLYAQFFCFENSIRDLIRERLQEKYGTEWTTQLSPKVVKFAQTRMDQAATNSWLEADRTDLLGFIEFGHLADIITSNWDDFSDLVPSQHWVRQRLEELEHARNSIAHNRVLKPGEFERISMYIRDWDRQIGL